MLNFIKGADRKLLMHVNKLLFLFYSNSCALTKPKKGREERDTVNSPLAGQK